MTDVGACLRAAVELVAEHVDQLDRLNVYPVPDEDTGRNLLATLRAALDDVDGDPARAATRGARGNSGVLLSQVLVPLLPALSVGGPAALAGALGEGARLARRSIAEPVAGSILDAADAAADAAASAVAAGAGVTDLLDRVLAAAHAAVEATTDRLPVLTDAGVVDAGARGLALVLEAVAAQVVGRDPAPPPLARTRPRVTRGACGAGLPSDGRHEVMATVDAAGLADALRDRLAGVGASVQVVPLGERLRVHVHVDDVAEAVGVLLEHGVPSDLRVEHLGPDGGTYVLELPDALRATVVEAGSSVLLPPGAPAPVRRAVLAGLPTGALLLPGTGERVDPAATGAAVVDGAADGPRVLAALAVAGPAGAGVADQVRAAVDHVAVVPVARDGAGRLRVDGTDHPDAAAAVLAAVAATGREPELVQVHVAAGAPEDVDALRAAVRAALPGVSVVVLGGVQAAPALLVAVE